MKKLITFLTTLLISAIVFAQISQPPGGITGNLPPWTGGNGTSGQVLTSNGATVAPTFKSGSGGASPANPTASVGLTAANGTATTFMRSDAAPVLSLAITPDLSTPWTGAPWAWSSTEPRLILNQSGAGTDQKVWDVDVASGVFAIRTRTDAGAAGNNVFTCTRGTTTALTNCTIGYATTGTYSFPFTGLATFGGGATFGGTVTFGSSWSITTGGTATLLRALLNTATYIAGTKFTTSGCSVSSTTGGATAGLFTLGANSCNVVVTMGTGTLSPSNGWHCEAHDRTSPLIYIGGESTSSGVTATIAIPATAGTTDVISFSCAVAF